MFLSASQTFPAGPGNMGQPLNRPPLRAGRLPSLPGVEPTPESAIERQSNARNVSAQSIPCRINRDLRGVCGVRIRRRITRPAMPLPRPRRPTVRARIDRPRIPRVRNGARPGPLAHGVHTGEAHRACRGPAALAACGRETRREKTAGLAARRWGGVERSCGTRGPEPIAVEQARDPICARR